MTGAENIWHFTIDGQRKGPVSLGQIQELLSKGRLDPEKDLVWNPGMSEWAVVTSVPELAGVTTLQSPPASTKATQPKPQVVPEVVDPYEVSNAGASTSQLRAAMNERRGEYGGMGRLSYFLFPLIPFLALMAFLITQQHPVLIAGEINDGSLVLYIGLYIAIILLFVLYPMLSRLKNLGMSRLHFFWIFVPIMSIWIGYRMFACPAGYADHKQKDLIGKILTWFYFGPLVISVLAVIVLSLTGAWSEMATK